MTSRPVMLPGLIAERAAETPDRVFLQHVDGGSLSYRRCHEENLRWADGFRRIGVAPGQNVVTMLANTFESFHAWLGLSWLKAVEVPINHAYRGPMLRYALTHSEAETVVVSARFLDQLAEVASEVPTLRRVVVSDADGSSPDLPFEVIRAGEFLGAAEPADGMEAPEPWDVSCMIYTSGTTGPSKGVLVPWGEIHHFALAHPIEALNEGDALYSYWPPFHVSGKVMLSLCVTRSARMVVREIFSVSQFWEDVRRFGCTTAGLVGPLAKLLLMQPEQPDDADNPLVGVTCGPLFPELDEFKKRFGVEVGTGYGMTEIGGVLASDGWDIADWRSCGKVRQGPPGYQIRIVDEHDRPVPAGEVGELIVRSDEPWVMNAGYYGMPDATAAAWRNGWFHTGDGFRADAGGNLYFVDRMKDCLRRRGENISSFEVEAYVNAHPEVVESAAVGVPSELGEDEVKVVVVRTPDSVLTPQALIDFLSPTMPKFMLPRFVEFADALPKTVMARTRKIELREDPFNQRTWDRMAAGART